MDSNTQFTKADLANPDSRLFEVMKDAESLAKKFAEAVDIVNSIRPAVVARLENGPATAEELDENFFHPLDDKLSAILPDFF